MKYFKTFESHSSNDIVEQVYSILDGRIDREELTSILKPEVDEGFFSWIGGLFKNPMMKRKLDKLADQLTAIRIKIGTLELEGDPVERYKQELKDADKSGEYSSTSSFDYDDDNVHTKQIELLQKQEEEIVQMMDDLGMENDVLTKYVGKVKLESRMKSTEALMRVADSEVKRILGQIKYKDQRNIKDLDREIEQGYRNLESLVIESEETYSDYPAAAKANAKQAIEWKEKYGREVVKGGTEVGWARAHQLAKGESLSRDVVSRMAQFNRHRKNSKVASEFKDEPWRDNGYVAWLIWGGTEGVDWAMKKMDEIKKEESSNENKETKDMKYFKLFEQFVSEAKVNLDQLVDVLANLEDAFTEDEFIEFGEDVNVDSETMASIWNGYWEVEAKNRLHWGDKEWTKWLKSNYGVK